MDGLESGDFTEGRGEEEFQWTYMDGMGWGSIHLSLSLSICICIRVCVCVCNMYICICMVCTYIHTYIHTCMSCKCVDGWCYVCMSKTYEGLVFYFILSGPHTTHTLLKISKELKSLNI